MKVRTVIGKRPRKSARLARSALCALLACALALCCKAPDAHADLVPGQIDATGKDAGLPAIPYEGDEVMFVQKDLKTKLGMFGNPSGDMQASLEDGVVRISFTPGDGSAFVGFYLNASVSDKATWAKGNYVAAAGSASDGSLAYDFEIGESFCGRAWPVAPVKDGRASGEGESGATTSEQYYLAVPSADKLGGKPAEDATPLGKARFAIKALPDPKSALRDTGNEAVSSALAAYGALDDDEKAKLSDDERLLLAQCAIAVLPSDPFKVSAGHGKAIAAAESLAESLPAVLREQLDSDDSSKAISSSRSYGRYLENAVWALDALEPVDNATSLPDGTYTGQVESASSMGKSNSPRSIAFTVRSVTVKDGKATAVLEHGSNTSQTLKLGGVEYQNLQADDSGKSRFEVPVNLNSTFHFSVKGKSATDDTDAITYEMTVAADEASMKPDEPEPGEGDPGASAESPSAAAGAAGAASSRSGGGGGTNLNTLVRNNASPAAPAASARPSSASAAAPAPAAPASAPAPGAGEAGLKEAKELKGPVEGAGADVAGGDLGPAVAGCALLLAFAGALAFTLRFMRRESAPAKVGLW